MTDYQIVRQDAKEKGPLSEGAGSPIPIQPTTEYTLTRLITLPVRDEHKKKIQGKYMRAPAIITVAAFNPGEASARADEIQANTKEQAWGQGSKPWDGEGKTNWQEIDIPADFPIMELR